MSKLKLAREKANLTQEELATQSGVSVRTIQRIEAGTDPKGYTLKTLAKTLHIEPNELVSTNDPVSTNEVPQPVNIGLMKLINLASLPVAFLPPLNIILPLLIMFLKKEFGTMAKQLITIQILWAVSSFVLFMLAAFVRNWFFWSNKFTLIVMVLLALSNIMLIIWNAISLDKHKKPAIGVKFSLI